ncbi:MAG: DUF5935 domain-containing protein, partial [bacterium]
MALKGILYLLLTFVGIGATFRYPFAGIITFVLTNYLRPEIFSYGALVPFRIPLVVSVVTVISLVVHRNDVRSFRTHSPILPSLFLMLFFLHLSGYTAVNMDLSLHWDYEILKILAFCYVAIVLIDSENRLKKFLYANMIGAGFLAIWGFQQHFAGNVRLEKVGGGATDNSNGLATLFVLLLPLFIYLISNRKYWIKVMGMIMSGFLLADIIFTQSRAAFFAAGVMLIYIFLRLKTRTKYFFVLLAIPFLQTAMETTSLNDETSTERMMGVYDQGLTVDSSGQSRKELWRAGWEMF